METKTNQSYESIHVETNSEVDNARIFTRLLSFFLDNVILKIPIYIIVIMVWSPMIKNAGEKGSPVILLIECIVETMIVIGYFAFLAYYMNGQTIAKG